MARPKGRVVYADRNGMGAGKGDYPRPMDKKRFDSEYERIFGQSTDAVDPNQYPLFQE